MNDETIPLAPITPDAPANDLTPRPRPKRITHMHALGMAIAASSHAILPSNYMRRRNHSGRSYGEGGKDLRQEPPPAVRGHRNKPCPCGKVDANGKPVKFKHCCLKPKEK